VEKQLSSQSLLSILIKQYKRKKNPTTPKQSVLYTTAVHLIENTSLAFFPTSSSYLSWKQDGKIKQLILLFFIWIKIWEITKN